MFENTQFDWLAEEENNLFDRKVDRKILTEV